MHYWQCRFFCARNKQERQNTQSTGLNLGEILSFSGITCHIANNANGTNSLLHEAGTGIQWKIFLGKSFLLCRITLSSLCNVSVALAPDPGGSGFFFRKIGYEACSVLDRRI